MNAELLLALFDRLSEVPEAVPRLRSFILELAVRGKLVTQDVNDEPAKELLKRIEVEKRRSIEAGKIRKQDITPHISKEDEPFTIPGSWVWTRLGEIADWGSGSTPPRGNHEYYGGEISWLKSGELNDNEQLVGSEEKLTEFAVGKGSFRRNQPGDVLMAMYGATIGRAAILAEPAVTNQAVCGCTPFAGVFNRYLFMFLRAQRTELRSASEGGAQPNISKVKIVAFPFPLPPLAEQHRIVAKVDELMGLCDRLTTSQTEREGQRHRLAKAALHHLRNGANGEDIREPATFYFSHFSELTVYIGQITSLREAILDLAVRGRLVPQNSSEEPASELLKRIQAEKSLRIAEGTLRKEKPLPPIKEDYEPFAIPTGWSWARIGTCSLLTEYGTSVKSDRIAKGVPVLAMGDIQGGQVILSERKKVPTQIDDLPQLFLKRFDLLYNRTNSAELVGKTGIFMGEDDVFTFASYLIRIRFLNNLTNPVYSNIAMNAPYFRPTQIVPELRQQCGQANVNGSKLRNMMIPLPPFAEQKRIVDKVNELMALCDRLEAQLSTAQSKCRRLLYAVLNEALNGRGAPIDEYVDRSQAINS